jgi:hypothetical protein
VNSSLFLDNELPRYKDDLATIKEPLGKRMQAWSANENDLRTESVLYSFDNTFSLRDARRILLKGCPVIPVRPPSFIGLKSIAKD